MTSDTSLRSGDHPWTYDLLTIEPSSPYPTLSPYDDFASLRPTTRSPPPPQQDDSMRPPTPRPGSSTSHHSWRRSSQRRSRLHETRPVSTPRDALGIEIPHVPPLAPRYQFDTPPSFVFPNPPFVQASLSPPSINSSPSLSSSIATAPSSPDSPCWQHSSVFAKGWPLAEPEPIRTKRHFTTIRQAKRLPHKTEPPWEVHALIEVRESSSVLVGAQQHSTQQSQAEIPSKGLRRREADAHLQVESEESEEQSWSGRYVHYRGASFEVINPSHSLLLGKNSIETPAAEIDLLIDDYLNSVDTMSSSSSQHDLTPARQLYPDPEEARRAILRIPREGAQAQEESLAGPASGQQDNAESAISAILANYDHTTPSNAARRQHERPLEPSDAASPAVSETSDAEWLERVRHAREASPELPFHVAMARAYEQTPQREHGHQLSPAATGNALLTDQATTDRTYGDTNRLLQLTPASQQVLSPSRDASVMPAAQTPSQYSTHDVTRPTLRRVAGSVGTVVHNIIDRQPSVGLSTEEDESLLSSHVATFYNPFDAEEYEAEEDIDAEADWETEHVGSDSDNNSLANVAQPAYFADFDNDYTLSSNPSTVRHQPPRQDEVHEACHHLSTIYGTKIGSMHSNDNLSTSSAVNVRSSELAIRRIRHEAPEVFQLAINDFLQNHGQNTANELSRAWSANNGGQNRLSDSSFDDVIRQARLLDDRARLESNAHTIVAQHNRGANQAGLFYSPTANTFATLRPEPSRAAIDRLCPANVTPPQPIHRSETDIADFRPAARRAYGMRPGLRSMASMSSQTGLRDLHLTSTPTSNMGTVAARNFEFERPAPAAPRPTQPRRVVGRDMQLERSRARTTPLAQQRIEMTTLDSAGRVVFVRPRPTIDNPTLHPDRAPVRVGDDLLSARLFNPVGLLMIFFGYYDAHIQLRSGGTHSAADRAVKKEALQWAAFELSGFLIVGMVIGMFVIIGTIRSSSQN